MLERPPARLNRPRRRRPSTPQQSPIMPPKPDTVKAKARQVVSFDQSVRLMTLRKGLSEGLLPCLRGVRQSLDFESADQVIFGNAADRMRGITHFALVVADLQ